MYKVTYHLVRESAGSSGTGLSSKLVVKEFATAHEAMCFVDSLNKSSEVNIFKDEALVWSTRHQTSRSLH